MDLRDLKHFVTVYEEGSINGAAKRLRMAQPSVSAVIRGQALEELGTCLLYTSPSPRDRG